MTPEEENHMFQLRFHPRRALAIALATTIALPPAALAQTPAASAPAKPAPVAASQQKVELLFVQNSAGVAIDQAKGTLTLKNVSPSTLFFTDRPVRMAGHYHTRDEFLPLWNEGPDSLAKNPPNATLSIVEPGQADLQNVVVVLRNPRMQGNDLSYDIKLVEGTLPKAGNAAVLFIDILGIWRRNIRRVAVIGTAAAVTTAAVATTSAAAAAAAKPTTVNVQVTPPPKPAPQPSGTQKLEQLKGLLNEGLITQAQYQKASQEVVNEMVK
jgi:hypothetical protein